MSIPLISVNDYQKLIFENEHHIIKIQELIISTGELFEGNCFYNHCTFDRDPRLISKQMNIVSLARTGDRILEIGFNAGHSCLLLLIGNPNCKIDCFDICWHKYTKLCFDYLDNQFPNRLQLIEGDSTFTLLDWPEESYDLYHIDGGHSSEMIIADYENCRNHARENSIIIFDDTYLENIKCVWNKSLTNLEINAIKLYKTPHYSHDAGFVRKNMKHEYNIAVCTMVIGDEYKKICQLGTLSKKLYCQKHSYDFYYDEDDEVWDKTRPFAWSKIKLIQRYLKHSNKYDFVIWIDADTYIMNNNIKLEERINQICSNSDITFARDFKLPNTGVMFIRNTQWSLDFFKEVYEQTEFIEHPNWEQAAIINMYETNVLNSQQHINILPIYDQNLINSYWFNYNFGDFILHFPGCFRDGVNKGLSSTFERYRPIKIVGENRDCFKTQLDWIKHKSKEYANHLLRINSLNN